MQDIATTTENLFTWWTVVKLAFTTGLFTATFTQGLAWAKETVQDRTKTRRQGQQPSVELVTLLTAYAQECMDRLDKNEYEEDRGGYGHFHKMPELPAYPDGWAALPCSIAGALGDLRNEVTQATRDIEACGDIHGYPEAMDVANSRFVDVGHQALSISERLRKHYKLGSYQSATGYPFTKELRQRYRQNRRGLLGELWDSLPSSRLRRKVRKRWCALTKAIQNVISNSVRRSSK